jgi:hypothetical protein
MQTVKISRSYIYIIIYNIDIHLELGTIYNKINVSGDGISSESLRSLRGKINVRATRRRNSIAGLDS